MGLHCTVRTRGAGQAREALFEFLGNCVSEADKKQKTPLNAIRLFNLVVSGLDKVKTGIAFVRALGIYVVVQA